MSFEPPDIPPQHTPTLHLRYDGGDTTRPEAASPVLHVSTEIGPSPLNSAGPSQTACGAATPPLAAPPLPPSTMCNCAGESQGNDEKAFNNGLDLITLAVGAVPPEPPVRPSQSSCDTLSGEDEDGYTWAGYREPVREFRQTVPDEIGVLTTGLIDTEPAGDWRKVHRLIPEAVFAETWKSDDLAFSAPVARAQSTLPWTLKLCEDGLCLTVGSWTKRVRATSDLFFSPWHDSSPRDWPAHIERSQLVIAAFLGMLDSGDIWLTTNDEPGIQQVLFDAPLPAPTEGVWPGTERVSMVDSSFWCDYVSCMRGCSGPTWLVKSILVPPGYSHAGSPSVDSDMGLYELDFPQKGYPEREERWKLVQLADCPVFHGVPTYAYSLDLQDMTRQGILADEATLALKVRAGCEYFIIGKTVGLSYIRKPYGQDGGRAGATRHYTCGVLDQVNAYAPPRAAVIGAHHAIVKLAGTGPVSVERVSEVTGLTLERTVEALSDEEYKLSLSAETGCGLKLLRNQAPPGRLDILPITFGILSSSVVSRGTRGGYVVTLSKRPVIVKRSLIEVSIGGVECDDYIEPERLLDGGP